MNQSIKVLNLPEHPQQGTNEYLEGFLSGIDGIAPDIDVAHRTGPKPENENAYAHPIVAILSKRQYT